MSCPLQILRFNFGTNLHMSSSLGADASLCDHEGMTPFDVSQELQIQELLASGHNRLYVSVAKGDLDMVKKLIEKDRIHINVLFTHGNTPLHIACENEHADIADYLLQKGADVNRYVSDLFPDVSI